MLISGQDVPDFTENPEGSDYCAYGNCGPGSDYLWIDGPCDGPCDDQPDLGK